MDCLALALAFDQLPGNQGLRRVASEPPASQPGLSDDRIV